MSLKRTMGRTTLAAAWLMMAAAGVAAAEYPERPVRIIVPFEAGGITSVVTRLVADRLRLELGQPVVVDNKPGAGGTIGTALLARGAPDGYTLGVAVLAFAINATLFKQLPYDSERDFQPVSLMSRNGHVLLVSTALPPTNLKSLIDLVKANPGKYSYASGGLGTAQHLIMELLKAQAGINLEHIPYRGGAPALQATVAGETALIWDNVAASRQHVEVGKLRPLAVDGALRNPNAPQVPTMVESGFPDFVTYTWQVVLAPAGTPRPIVDRLSGAIGRVLKDPGVHQRLVEAEFEPIPDSTPESTADYLSQEVRKWGSLLRTLGLAGTEG
jgi:tripartite-type tricarboxylate transporter receptor subunit TctC